MRYWNSTAKGWNTDSLNVDQSSKSLELYGGVCLLFWTMTVQLCRVISSYHLQLLSLIFFSETQYCTWCCLLPTAVVQPSRFVCCLRFVHYLLVNLARLMLFSVPAISFIHIIETIQYWNTGSLSIFKTEEEWNALAIASEQPVSQP